jgi:hypothetical protein
VQIRSPSHVFTAPPNNFGLQSIPPRSRGATRSHFIFISYHKTDVFHALTLTNHAQRPSRRSSLSVPEFQCTASPFTDAAVSMICEDVGGEIVFDEYPWMPVTPQTAPESPWQSSLGSHTASVTARDATTTSMGFHQQYLSLFPTGVDEISYSISGSTSTFCDSTATSAEVEQGQIVRKHTDTFEQDMASLSRMGSADFGACTDDCDSAAFQNEHALEQEDQPEGSIHESDTSVDPSRQRQKLSRLLWQSMRIRNGNQRLRNRRSLANSMPETLYSFGNRSEQVPVARGRRKAESTHSTSSKSWIFVEEKPS